LSRKRNRRRFLICETNALAAAGLKVFPARRREGDSFRRISWYGVMVFSLPIFEVILKDDFELLINL